MKLGGKEPSSKQKHMCIVKDQSLAAKVQRSPTHNEHAKANSYSTAQHIWAENP